MDKSTTRKILYRPEPNPAPAATPAKKDTPEQITPEPKPPKDPPSQAAAPEGSSADIWAWLEANKKFIKAKAICEEVGMDAGNFSRLQKKRGEIPPSYLIKITQLLQKFGYGK